MQSSWHNVPEVDQVPQAAGAGHASQLVRDLLSTGAAELSTDIAGPSRPKPGSASGAAPSGWTATKQTAG